jgi:hypothetical protein
MCPTAQVACENAVIHSPVGAQKIASKIRVDFAGVSR